MNIESLNPESEGYFYMREFTAATENGTLIADLEDYDDNDVVTIEWKNASLTVRAGTVRAWIERAAIEKELG